MSEEQLDLLGLIPDYVDERTVPEPIPIEPIDRETAEQWAQVWFEERTAAWREQRLLVHENADLLVRSLRVWRDQGPEGLRALIEEVGRTVSPSR